MAVIDYSQYLSSDGREPGQLERYLRPIARITVPILLGIIMTVGLFYLMQALISSGGTQLSKPVGIHLVDFVRAPKLSEVQTKTLHPKKPPPPPQEPPVKQDLNFNVKVDKSAWGMRPMQISNEANLKGAFSFASDGNYLPIFKVAPVYPTSALLRGLEGWVVLSFTVDELGRVVDPVVVDNCAQTVSSAPNQEHPECTDMPNRVFDRAALNAAVKFKYKPKVVDGVAVSTPHVRNKIVFVIK